MSSLYTIGFYNTENLFDTIDDPHRYDDDFTPNGSRKWVEKKYRNKIGKLSMTISKIGLEETSYPPSIMGVAEVENDIVMRDLIDNQNLGTEIYDFVHYESWDERGIDVALIYNKNVFKVEHSEPLRPPMIYNGNANDLTRDVLYVRGKLANRLMHIFVLHMPSRREDGVNQPKRHAIAEHLNNKISYIQENEEDPKIVILGDFNAQPKAKSLKKFIKSSSKIPRSGDFSFFNPMEILQEKGQYSNFHKREKLLFDQILFSSGFFLPHRSQLVSTKIFMPYFLQEWNEKYKNQPFRTYVGWKYLGGYSDHYPVYSIIKI